MDCTKEFRFESSHILPRHKGKCSRLHGHSWILKITVSGDVDPETGFVMDYADISKAAYSVIERLDHNHLGTWASGGGVVWNRAPHWNPNFAVIPDEHFYPTSENLIVWIGGELDLCFRWSKLELNETCTSSCVLMREEYEIIIASSSRSVETTNRTVKEEQILP